MMNPFWIYTLLAVAGSTLAQQTQPQTQPNPSIDETVRQLFQLTPSQPPRNGANTIVTPEPFDPSQNMQFTSISGRQAQCTCVPYHMCDPNAINNNNGGGGAVTPPPPPTDDGTFDGFGQIDIRFNADDDPVCDHFLDVCCGGAATRNQSLTPTPVDTRPNHASGCGVRNVGGIDFNITGANDNEAGFGEFPWTVALLFADSFTYFCGGSLIHPQVVLTAVHCVINRPISNILVRAGEWDTQTTKERLPYVERNVQRVITHPQYNSRNVANNFALLVLSSPIPLGDHINVICLPGQGASPAARTTCFSTGWGKDLFGAEGRFSVIMKRVPLPIVDFSTCQSQLQQTRLGPRFALDRTFICAGGVRGVDTCQGDGGAPLVCPIGIPTDNRYQQSGIVSWGIGCNDPVPAAYADVAGARSWIDQQMIAAGFGTASYSAF